ncbi:MAG: hypothetical protein ACR2H5_11620 [Ktedonobacteraceae bacterium]
MASCRCHWGHLRDPDSLCATRSALTQFVVESCQERRAHDANHHTPIVSKGGMKGYLAALANDGVCLCVVGGTRSGGGIPPGAAACRRQPAGFYVAKTKALGAVQVTRAPLTTKRASLLPHTYNDGKPLEEVVCEINEH